MAQRSFSRVIVIALALTGIILTATTFGAITVSQNLSSSGSIVTSANIGVYSDSACTTSLTSIDWGTISPGGSVTKTVYVKNIGAGVSLTLSMATGNWNPASASGPITITWDKAGAILSPGSSTAAVITLSVSSSITDILSFSVQIVITGTAG